MLGQVIRTSTLSAVNKNSKGFSMVDLIVALSLFLLLSMIALPKLPEYMTTFNRVNARTHLIQDLRLAQAETVTPGCRGIFIIDGDNGGYTFGCDYLPYDTSDPPSYDEQEFSRTLPDNITVDSSARIIFNSRGQVVDKDDVLVNRTVELTDTSDGSVKFMTGTLYSTGVVVVD